MTVYDYLTQRGLFRAEQLFVGGFGANHPVVSNATPAGKERNRRVELVVYPEQVTPARRLAGPAAVGYNRFRRPARTLPCSRTRPPRACRLPC